MPLFYVTGREIHGECVLATSRKEVRSAFNGPGRVTIKRLDAVPYQFFRDRHTRGLALGRNPIEAYVWLVNHGLAPSMSVKEIEGRMERQLCPRLLLHPLGVQLWTSAGFKALYQDFAVCLAAVRDGLLEYNRRIERTAPADGRE